MLGANHETLARSSWTPFGRAVQPPGPPPRRKVHIGLSQNWVPMRAQPRRADSLAGAYGPGERNWET